MENELPQLPGMDTQKELDDYKQKVFHCLIKYGGFDKETARQKMRDAYFFARLDNAVSLMNLFHEEPYYWAMTLIQTNPDWHRNPKLWPPPDDCYD